MTRHPHTLLLAALSLGPVLAQHELPSNAHTPDVHDHGSEPTAPTLELGLVFDATLDHRALDDQADGFSAEVRTLGLTLAGRAGDDWRVNATIVHETDGVELEEAFATYHGLGDRTSARAGRFFIDFGREMRLHVHDLPTPDRPGVLAAYLGAEAPGTGVQLARRWPTSERASVRASLGVFTDLKGHRHEDEAASAEVAFAERVEADEVGLTARLSWRAALEDERHVSAGLSARHLADFALADELSGLRAEGLTNTVYGIDLSFESRGWAVGGEALVNSGHLGAETQGASLAVVEGDAHGFYVWGERRFESGHAVGLLVGSFEHPEAGLPSEDEWTAYYSRTPNDSARLRFAATQRESDDAGSSTRLLVQLTLFAGSHAHGALD